MDESGPIAIVDRNDVYGRGLQAALEDEGFDVELPAEGQSSTREMSLALVSVRCQEDWDLLARLREEHEELPVVGVLPEPTLHSYCRALAAGATAIVADDAPLPELVDAVKAALRNMTLLPTNVARTLATGESDQADATPISADEAEWLRAIARGTTIAQLAEQASYSEREMHRLLRRLYARMGADNRAEALVLATRWGVLA